MRRIHCITNLVVLVLRLVWWWREHFLVCQLCVNYIVLRYRPSHRCHIVSPTPFWFTWAQWVEKRSKLPCQYHKQTLLGGWLGIVHLTISVACHQYARLSDLGVHLQYGCVPSIWIFDHFNHVSPICAFDRFDCVVDMRIQSFWLRIIDIHV